VGENAWHLVSVPNSVTTANSFLGNYLQTWTETSAQWNNITNPATPLNTGIGYALWSEGEKASYTYTGTPLTGDQSVGVTLSDNFPNPLEGNDGANLLGNPYPSFIDWGDLDETWGAVYYWDATANEGAGDYLEWNNNVGAGSQFIPPMQGFFIVTSESNTTAGSGTFVLSNANRTHAGATNYYKSQVTNGIILTANSGSKTDELYIIFDENATPGFDLKFDALKFFAVATEVSQLFSLGDDRKLAIDVRPETEVVQLGFVCDQGGVYSITSKEMDGIAQAILEDTKLNIFHNLQNGPYDFAWEIADNEKRFKLHLNAIGIEETPISEGSIQIYASGQEIFIKGAEKGQVQVLDVMGRSILQKEISGQGFNSIPANLQTGVYVVMVRSGDEIRTEKIFIN